MNTEKAIQTIEEVKDYLDKITEAEAINSALIKLSTSKIDSDTVVLITKTLADRMDEVVRGHASMWLKLNHIQVELNKEGKTDAEV